MEFSHGRLYDSKQYTGHVVRSTFAPASSLRESASSRPAQSRTESPFRAQAGLLARAQLTAATPWPHNENEYASHIVQNDLPEGQKGRPLS